MKKDRQADVWVFVLLCPIFVYYFVIMPLICWTIGKQLVYYW